MVQSLSKVVCFISLPRQIRASCISFYVIRTLILLFYTNTQFEVLLSICLTFSPELEESLGNGNSIMRQRRTLHGIIVDLVREDTNGMTIEKDF